MEKISIPTEQFGSKLTQGAILGVGLNEFSHTGKRVVPNAGLPKISNRILVTKATVRIDTAWINTFNDSSRKTFLTRIGWVFDTHVPTVLNLLLEHEVIIFQPNCPQPRASW